MRVIRPPVSEYDSIKKRGGKMEHAENTDNLRKEKEIMQDLKGFTKGIEEINLSEMLDENNCRKWILQRVHPQGPHCPGCDKPIQSQKGLQNFWEGKRVFCKHCNKLFTAATGTMLAGLQIDFRTLYFMAVLLGLKVDRKKIATSLRIHPDTVKQWEGKFKAFEEAGKE